MPEHVVTYRDEPTPGAPPGSGREYKLDLSTGRLYDLGGNQVAHWTPADDDRSAMLADFVSDESVRTAAYAMSLVDRDRARGMISAQTSGRSIAMDLGPSDVHIPSAMPNFASGYRNEVPIADLVAPPLLVPKQVDDYHQFAKEDAFQRALPQAASHGAGIPEISPRIANAQYSCRQRAVGGFVSAALQANADAPLKMLQATSRRILNVLAIEREIRVANLMLNPASWNGGNVGTLGPGMQWNGGPSSDPIKDIHTRMESSWGAITGMAMSEPVWHDFVRNTSVRAYHTYKDSTAPLPSVQQMQAILQLPPIYIGRMRSISPAGRLEYIWGNHVVFFRQPEELPPTTQDDVATCYTFRWTVPDPRDGVAQGGYVVRQFWVQDRDGLGGLKIVVLHYDAEQMTSQFVGGILIGAHQ